MRCLAASVFLAAFAAGQSFAQTAPRKFQAGATRIAVEDVVPFEALVTYPTDRVGVPFEDGPRVIAASRDAPIASTARFPIVLFSHGGGTTLKAGGSPLPYADLATSLARDGFIVVAPFHPGAQRPLEERPRHVHKALEAMLADPRFASHADPERLGMMGFSWGGAVSLIAAGAVPNLAHLGAYCRDHADDPKACEGVPTDGSLANVVGKKSADVLALKALVLLEPWGALFGRSDLASVDMPILLYRAEGSDLKAEGNIIALAAALPRPPMQKTVPGSHFIFGDPCPAARETEAPEFCKDPPGVDRSAVHRRIEIEIGSFFGRVL
jgi:predicted dienelactone hydrolase